jgi:hypothetical protein
MAITNPYQNIQQQSIANDQESFIFIKKYNATIEMTGMKHYKSKAFDITKQLDPYSSLEHDVEPVVAIKLPLSDYRRLMYTKDLFSEIENHIDDPVVLDFLSKLKMYMNLKY